MFCAGSVPLDVKISSQAFRDPRGSRTNGLWLLKSVNETSSLCHHLLILFESGL